MPVPLIRVSRNPLAYPCGVAPGFDPTHPAAPGCVFSGVSDGGNFINILTGIIGALTATPTVNIDGAIGASTRYTAATDKSTFTIAGPGSPTGATIASIFRLDSINNANQICIFDSSNSSLRSHLTTALLEVAINTTANASNITLVAGVPYFAAASFKNASTLNFVATNLATGQISSQSRTTASSLSTTAATSLTIGNNVATGVPLKGILAADMWAYNTFLSLSQLLAWASDPWSFWYPERRSYRVGISPVVGWGPLIAQRRNRFIGSGMVLQ